MEQASDAHDKVEASRPPEPIWRRFVWFVIPLTVFLGDYFIRWNADLGQFLERENPENIPITLFVSAAFWWAVSVMLPEGRSRRPLAIAVSFPWALLVTMAWGYKLTIKHDPNPGVLIYLLYEPKNALQMISTGVDLRFILNLVGLWSLWSWALNAARTRGSNVITLAAAFVLVGWLVASAGWHDTRPDRETPYVSDINVNVMIARAIGRAAEYGTDAILSSAERRPVQLDDPPDVRRPDVVVFVGESLRRDRMSIYGCERQTTPHLDAFFAAHRDRIVDFPRARAASAFTPLALATILTGQYPASGKEELHQHPVLWQFAHALDGQSAAVSTQLWSWSNLSLFFLISEPPTFSRSADNLDSDIVNDTGVDDRLAARAFADLLRTHDPDGPFFGVFQANSTHYPLLADDDTPWSIDVRPDLYDSSVRVTDEAFGIIVDSLEKSGRLDDTIIVFTSDHGEFNWDKLETDLPGKTIANDLETGERIESCHPVLAHVPFFVYLPDGFDLPIETARANRDRAVSTADIYPTVLDAWSLPLDAGGAAPDGKSVLHPIEEGRQVYCFTAPPWARWLLTGVAVYDSERAVYVREDFRYPQVFDLDEPNLYREQYAGSKPTAEDEAWLEDAARAESMVEQYLEWSSEGAESLGSESSE